ncbi:glycosyltransferase family 4 protein [Aeromonas salmonicida]|uniref:glycosyltransferase family 4 protein n=1 Tax=Aeromonas salmonicida TaxID=645 RepID=UPI00370D7FA3
MKYMSYIIAIDRILDDDKKITIGGIQTYLVSLCQLIMREFKVKPVIYQTSSSDFIYNGDYFDVIGVKSAKRNKLGCVFTRIIKDHHNNRDSSLLIWGSDQYSIKQKFFKSVSIQHGIGFDTEASFGGVRKLLVDFGLSNQYKLLQRMRAINLFERADYCVCVDYNFPNWYRTFRSGWRENVKVIPNFTMLPERDFEKKNSPTIKVLYARRFVARRGVDIAIGLASRLVDKYTNVEFYFAGDGENRDKIIALTKSHERIFLTSYNAEDSIDFHRKFSIAIVPSIGSEGTSLSLLEAMASKCAVIASSVGGMTNIVLDGFNGYLVEPDVQSFYEKVELLLENENLLSSIQSNAYRSVFSSFSKEKWETSWVDFLRKI